MSFRNEISILLWRLVWGFSSIQKHYFRCTVTDHFRTTLQAWTHQFFPYQNTMGNCGSKQQQFSELPQFPWFPCQSAVSKLTGGATLGYSWQWW